MEKPVVKKRRGISPIWILPFIALCIGGWLLYKGITERSIRIIVHFHSADGVTAGKTKVVYKGLPVGVVKKITVDKGLDTVSMHIDISPEAKDGLVKGLKFWIVRPEIKAGKISGLSTLLSGSYIAVQPGDSEEPCREFMGLDEAPPIPDTAPGLHIKLRTDALHSIQRGSPVYYRNIQVGSVQDYSLDDGRGIIISAYIEPAFAKTVKPGTRFWNASGITLAGGLSGIKFHMESLSSLISGGISFVTPETFKDQVPVKSGYVFKLYRDYEEAEYGISVTLKLEAGEGMIEGITKVIFRGIEVGRIKRISLNNNDSKYKVTAHLYLDPMAESILRKGTRFWIIRPKLSMGEVKNLDTLVTGPYITFMPGDGEPWREFTVQGSASKPVFREGIWYRLAVDDLRSITPGTPVLFKHIQVGEVSRYMLNKDNSVDLIFIIYDDYTHLLNSKCVFWNYSGLSMQLTPTSFRLDADSLQSIVSGGIVFDYPHKYYGKKLKTAESGHRFKLYDSYSKAVAHSPCLKPKGLIVKLETNDPIYLSPGSPVYYKRVQVGEVTGVFLDSDKDKIFIDTFIDDEYSHLVRNNTRFFNMGGMSIKGSIKKGMTIKTPPVAAVLIGGITFFNPEQEGPQIKKDRHVFRLYQDYDDALEKDYEKLTVRFHRADIVDINTDIRFHGLKIGYVKKIKIEDGVKAVSAECLVKPEAVDLFRQQTLLWLVKPEISLARIRNLSTIVTGPYITLRPGGGAPCREFTLRSSPPPNPQIKTGLNLVVESRGLGSINHNSPVYYRQMKVGSVTGYELAPDSTAVWIHINIDEHYAPIVTTNTKFWNVSGVKVDAGLFSGVDIKTESLEAIVAGGIAFATPEGDEMGRPVKSGHHYILYEEADDDWLEWQPAILLKR